MKENKNINNNAANNNFNNNEPDMYQLIRKGGIGERAEPIYYRQVIAHFYGAVALDD